MFAKRSVPANNSEPKLFCNNEEITQERDYTTGLDEIAKGISSDCVANSLCILSLT